MLRAINPKGTTLVAGRHRELAEVVARHGVPVLDDDPYGERRFRRESSTPIAALADGLTFYVGTASGAPPAPSRSRQSAGANPPTR
jgi:2-aminoadipate transaminase